jgi:hypothetical protein
MVKSAGPDLLVQQNGNRIDISYAGYDVWIEVSGVDLPVLDDYSFAVWMLLPLAMRLRLPINVVGAVDKVVLDNARELAKIWELWAPEQFRSIPISAEIQRSNVRKSSSDAKLFLYSGGVDSTYMLLQPGVITSGSHALTVHGLDYKLKDEVGFSSLIDKTTPLLQRLGLKRIVLKTNLASVVKNLSLNHGFCLAGCGFIFRDIFSSVNIAADYNIAQEMLAFPWGTNHVTNPLFSGSNYRLGTMNGDVSRTEKIAFLGGDANACNSITFCGKWEHRPDNCGRCDKCIRTKAMFLVEKGEVPQIFKCNLFDKRHVNSIDLSTRKELAFISELITRARKNGVLNRLFGLDQRYERAIRTLSLDKKSRLSKLYKKIKHKLLWLGA